MDAACLAHDIGHSPFGHNGEFALNELAASCGGFEGNAQSLRLLTRLEPKVEGAGLNLTRATLDATLKYAWFRQSPGTKFGVYAEDAEVFAWVRSAAPDRRRCLEAQVMDWADDVAYSVHDMEDGFHAGLITFKNLQSQAERAEESATTATMYCDDDVPVEELTEILDALLALDVWPARRRRPRHRGRAEEPDQRADRALLPGRPASHPRRGRRTPPPPLTRPLLTRYGADLIVPRQQRLECALLKGITAYYVMTRPGVLAAQARERELLTELAYAVERGAPATLDPLLRPTWDAAGTDVARRRGSSTRSPGSPILPRSPGITASAGPARRSLRLMPAFVMPSAPWPEPRPPRHSGTRGSTARSCSSAPNQTPLRAPAAVQGIPSRQGGARLGLRPPGRLVRRAPGRPAPASPSPRSTGPRLPSPPQVLTDRDRTLRQAAAGDRRLAAPPRFPGSDHDRCCTCVRWGTPVGCAPRSNPGPGSWSPGPGGSAWRPPPRRGRPIARSPCSSRSRPRCTPRSVPNWERVRRPASRARRGIPLRRAGGRIPPRPRHYVGGRGTAADVMVIGIGAVPNEELAARAGLEVSNGVVTDEALRTSDPSIFAAGDVAKSFNPLLGQRVRVEHWANALNGGPAAAKSMLGQPVVYDPVPYFYSDQYDLGMECSGLPKPGSYDQVAYRGDRKTGIHRVLALPRRGHRRHERQRLGRHRRHPVPDPLHRQVNLSRLTDPTIPLPEV